MYSFESLKFYQEDIFGIFMINSAQATMKDAFSQHNDNVIYG